MNIQNLKVVVFLQSSLFIYRAEKTFWYVFYVGIKKGVGS
jgi:hypothetical protein